MPLTRAIALFCGMVCTEASHAHFYVDFAIEDISFDENCKANILVRNTGDGVPPHLYDSHHSINLKIHKGGTQESGLSIIHQDKLQRLRSGGGSSVIQSKYSYENNPTPITVAFEYAEEFGDYNQKNNQLTRAIDCKIGKGEIPGNPIVYTQPDVAITSATIDKNTCTAEIQLKNTTQIPLKAAAWDTVNGIQLVEKNSKSGDILSKTPLNTIDPNKHFTLKGQSLTWRFTPSASAKQISVHIWHVKGDLNFSNNHATLDVPPACFVKQ